MRALYRCLWPNGDVSLVWAPNKAEAILGPLDEVASATPDMLHVIGEDCAIHFVPVADEEDDEEGGAKWALDPTHTISDSLFDHGAMSFDLAKACLAHKTKLLAARRAEKDEHDRLYPEHAKTARIVDKSQVIGAFLDWARETHSLSLGAYHEDPNAPRASEREFWAPTHMPIRRLLAEFFEIDEDKLEAEKQAMLEACRKEPRD